MDIDDAVLRFVEQNPGMRPSEIITSMPRGKDTSENDVGRAIGRIIDRGAAQITGRAKVFLRGAVRL